MLNNLLRLERSLFVLDLETTGLNPEVDRIIQIALTQVKPTGDAIAWTQLVNPLTPILNSKVHGITDDMVQSMPTWAQLAPPLGPKLLQADLAGHNVTFDVNFIRAEMKRAGVDWPWAGHLVDTLQVFRKKHPHTLSAAYKHYVDEKGFEGAHDAGNDVAATLAVLEAQLNAHQDLPRTVKDLSEFCFPPVAGALDREGKFVRDAAGHVIMNFGGPKGHRGKRLKDVPRDYLEWMLKGTFQDDAKRIVEDALNGVYP